VHDVLLVLITAVVVLAIAFGAQRALQSIGSKAPEMDGMPGMSAGEMAPAPPSGASSAAVYIPPARQQLIGVRTGVVERHRAGGATRTVGVLAYDETRVTHIHVKVAGWAEQLFVNYTGKPVRRGQPLFAVYSPDLVTAQTDYLIALRARRQLGDTALPDAKSASDALVAAARERLRRWDVTDPEIAALEASGKASRTVTLVSPFDGVVLERMTFAGQYVTPDMSTFKIGDLSTLWGIGQAFEYEAAAIRTGESVDVEFPYGQTAQTLTAKIDFVYPDIDPQTRRIRFRVTLPNKDGHLKPDTYVTFVIHGDTVEHLVVPKEAVIDTGERKYVLLALADGYFDPRDVVVGPPLGDVYPVISGLRESDRVVTSAQFLVDSETNLMAAMLNMAMSMPGMNMGEMKPTPTPAPSGSAMPPMPGIVPSPPTVAPSAPPHEHKHAPPAPPKPAPPPMPSMPGMDMSLPQAPPSAPPAMPPMHHHEGM
jgi:RND family efflux transporter MFP subunit